MTSQPSGLDRSIYLDVNRGLCSEQVNAEAHFVDAACHESSLQFPLSGRPYNPHVHITSFVGREREKATVKGLLQAGRLVTLIGHPGTGKTRLALQIADDLRDHFEDGVYFVNLAPIVDPDLVLSTITQTLSIQEEGRRSLLHLLTSVLRDKHMLLLLDNFEQVIPAAPVIIDLISAAPRLKVLVTSREALRLLGEHRFFVPALDVPDLSQPLQPDRLMNYSAIQLFLERARAVKPDFTLTHETAPAVAEICVRLDGLPLAIELIASRISALSPQAVLQQLDSRLMLLTEGPRDLPPRQRTLHQAFDWSYNLLEESDKKLLWRASVFAGGRSRQALEAVCNPNEDLGVRLVDGLQSLVDKSLLWQAPSPDGEARF